MVGRVIFPSFDADGNLLRIPNQDTALKAADEVAGDLAGVVHGRQPFDNDLFDLFGMDRVVRRGLFFGRTNDQLGGDALFGPPEFVGNGAQLR